MRHQSAAVLGRNIWVVGTSGCGKTTLAASLAHALALSHIELDAIYQGPNWTPCPPDEFRSKVRKAVAEDGWVCDGNYSAVRDCIMERIDAIIWLDLSFSVVFTSAVRRTLLRWWRREVLWNGNRERLWPKIFTREFMPW